jgi:putative phage-type endonuclease
MEQRTDEWFSARLGKVTASRIGDVMARTKTGYSASRANYMAQLVVERLTNRKEESYTNAAMQWGTENEPLARSAYEVANDVLVKEVGFIDHPEIANSGASPDGLVGDDGMVEIKCPNTATHIETLLNNTIDGKYRYQMLWQMRCTNRKWCDFVSFDPRMPEELQLKIIRVDYDQAEVDQIEAEVTKFLSEVDEKVKKLNEVKNGISQ